MVDTERFFSSSSSDHANGWKYYDLVSGYRTLYEPIDSIDDNKARACRVDLIFEVTISSY